MSREQTVKVEPYAGCIDLIPSVVITQPDHKPSWKRFGNGSVEACFSIHRTAKWIDVSISETSKPIFENENRVVTRTCHMSLYEPAARALYNQLHEVFGQ